MRVKPNAAFRVGALAAILLAAGAIDARPHATPIAAVPAPAIAPPESPFEVFEKSIPELQAALIDGRVTSVDLVEAYLRRIAAYDHGGPALNAVVTLNSEALAEAARLDRERKRGAARGPLFGIPILVKDNFDTMEMPTSGGTIALASVQPATDAFQVARLRQAGAIILGKTTMHELAFGVTNISSLTGMSRNPYDERRTPGGSSGGTAAAVAASFAAAGMGTDTCGSIQIPASHQNLFGIRETRGLSSRGGILPASSTQDVAGPLARSVTDLAILMDATVAIDPEDSSTDIGARAAPAYARSLRPGGLAGARIGLLRAALDPDRADPDVLKKINSALEAMRAQGAQFVDIAIPGLEAIMKDASMVFEFKFDFADYLLRHPGAPIHSLAEIIDRGLLHDAVIERLRKGNEPATRDSAVYRAARAKRDDARAMILKAMGEAKVNFLAYPAASNPPRIWGAEDYSKSTCGLSATTGLPAVTVPLGLSEKALPVGLAFLGKDLDEAGLLNLAFGWEQAMHPRVPPTSTPPLVNGRAPKPRRFEVRVAGPHEGAPVATISFRYDVSKSLLSYDARISRLGRDLPIALTLQRGESTTPGPVMALLLRKGQTAGVSQLYIEPAYRTALVQGRLYVHLYTRNFPLGIGRSPAW